MTFTFCPSCAQKWLLKGSGNKLNHFKGQIMKCHKCSGIFIITKDRIKHLLDMELRELIKLGLKPRIEFV